MRYAPMDKPLDFAPPMLTDKYREHEEIEEIEETPKQNPKHKHSLLQGGVRSLVLSNLSFQS